MQPVAGGTRNARACSIKSTAVPDIEHVRALPCLFRDIVETADACDRCKDTK